MDIFSRTKKEQMMCEWEDKVILSVPVPANLSHTGKMFWKMAEIDHCIAPIIKTLNDAKIYTSSCCCGHGRCDGSILLHDGRELIIKNKEG